MENTLEVGDRVMVAKFGGFQRGDVVVFKDPGGWLSPTRKAEVSPVQKALEFVGVLPNSDDGHLIKRVIGMPGDHVCVTEAGAVQVNGVALDERQYLFSQEGVQVSPSLIKFDVVVPRDHIFVMGDHRDDSNDSRFKILDGDGASDAAFVPSEDVVGAAVATVAPLQHLGTFVIPDTYRSVPDPDLSREPLARVGVGCSNS